MPLEEAAVGTGPYPACLRLKPLVQKRLEKDHPRRKTPRLIGKYRDSTGIKVWTKW